MSSPTTHSTSYTPRSSVFSYGEILACHERCFPMLNVQDMEERFKKWGGIVRYVLAKIHKNEQSQLERAFSLINLDKLPGLLKSGEIESDDVGSHISLIAYENTGRNDRQYHGEMTDNIKVWMSRNWLHSSKCNMSWLTKTTHRYSHHYTSVKSITKESVKSNLQ